MSEWKEIRLGDIIKIKSGLPYKGEFLNKGRNYLLGMGCVSFSETFLMNGARRYSDDGKPQYIGKPGDIVLATRQQSDNLPILGMPAIIPSSFDEDKVIVGSNLYMVENNSDVDNKFIFWLLRTPKYINHIKYSQTGTTVRMITKKDIENFTFSCPPKNERDAISSLLWNLQEKIETNRRINARLEELAQAIFKSWFIDYEPFGGQKPDDWKECNLGDILVVKYGKDHKKLADGTIPVYGSGGIMRYAEKSIYEKESVLIPRKGTLNNIIYVDDPFWSVDTMFFTEMKKTNVAKYIFFWLKRLDFESMNSGSAIPSMTTNILNALRVDLPSDEVLKKFESSINPIFSRIKLRVYILSCTNGSV